MLERGTAPGLQGIFSGGSNSRLQTEGLIIQHPSSSRPLLLVGEGSLTWTLVDGSGSPPHGTTASNFDDAIEKESSNVNVWLITSCTGVGGSSLAAWDDWDSYKELATIEDVGPRTGKLGWDMVKK